MRSGISYPAFAATFTLTSGTAITDFPVTNLADLQSPRTVFKAATGAITIAFDLGAERDVQMLAFIHHNAAADDTFRVRLYDASVALVHDSGTLNFFTTGPVNLFPQSTPYVITAGAVAAKTAVIDLSSNPGWVIGALGVSGWWEWTDVQVPRSFGLAVKSPMIALADGVQKVQAQWASRILSGSRILVDVTAEETTIQDFQRTARRYTPFVWVWDYDDPTTWPREVFLVRNATVPRLSRAEYPSGEFKFDFLEHFR